MLKWGARLLAVFAILLVGYMQVSRPYFAVKDYFFYPLIFSGLLGLELLIAGLVQRFVMLSRPYFIFVVTAILVCLSLCIYGCYDVATDTSDFLPGMFGALVIVYSLIFHFVFLVGAGFHYYFVGRKKVENNQ